MCGQSRLGRIGPAATAGVLAMLMGMAGGGCAARQSLGVASPSPAPGAAAESPPPTASTNQSPDAKNPSTTPLAPQPKVSDLPTIEATDAGLAAAVAELRAEETVATLSAAAAEYLRVGVFDRADTLLGRAIKLAPNDGMLFAARARVWREWGLPEVALADAHRAVFMEPGSSDAHNTLGTVLFAVGAMDAASASFERALALEPDAAWAMNNLCYTALMRGREADALARCRAALDRSSGLSTAQNNLALVHAAAGRLDDARAAFLATGDRAAALYNMGIVYLSRREFGAAAESFGAACREVPTVAAACARAVEAGLVASPTRKRKP